MLLKEWLAIKSKDTLELLGAVRVKFDVNTGQFVDFVGGPQGFNPLAPKQTVVNQGDTLSQIAQKNGTT
jgi:LysM repeat protein